MIQIVIKNNGREETLEYDESFAITKEGFYSYMGSDHNPGYSEPDKKIKKPIKKITIEF